MSDAIDRLRARPLMVGSTHIVEADLFAAMLDVVEAAEGSNPSCSRWKWDLNKSTGIRTARECGECGPCVMKAALARFREVAGE